MLPSKKDRNFILRVNDKQFSRKVSNPPVNNEDFHNENRSPITAFNRSNSSFKKPIEIASTNPLKSMKSSEDKDYNKLMMGLKASEFISITPNLSEISDKEIMNSKIYQEMKLKFQEEKSKNCKYKKILSERESEIQALKQDKMQLYNKVTMMDEQIRNYESAFEERKENNVEVAFPDFQSLLLALRYSGDFNASRTLVRPVRDELNPDQMTYEELVHLEEQMGNVSRGYSEEQLTRLNSFVFNSKFNPNCNNQDSCSVCFSEFAAGNRLNKLGCGHVYHNNCIRPWLLKEKTCPVCKAIVNL